MPVPAPSSAFTEAIFNGQLPAARAWLASCATATGREAMVNTPDPERGLTPLMQCLLSANELRGNPPGADFPGVVSALLDAGATVDVADKSGQMPIHHALARDCSTELTRRLLALLIQKGGADVNRVNGQGLSVLLVAAGRSDLDACRLLMQLGARAEPVLEAPEDKCPGAAVQFVQHCDRVQGLVPGDRVTLRRLDGAAILNGVSGVVVDPPADDRHTPLANGRFAVSLLDWPPAPLCTMCRRILPWRNFAT